MDIFVSQVAASREKAEYVITVLENGFTLTNGEKSWTFDPALIEFYPDILNLVVDQKGEFRTTWFSETTNNRDGLVAQRTRNMSFDINGRYAVSVALLPDHTWHVYCNHSVYVENANAVEVGYMKSTDVFVERFPSLAKFVQHGRAKQRALGRINQSDSVAALEIQVDLLVRVVKQLLAANPELKPQWWDDYVAAVSANESTAVYADEAAAIASIAEEKSRVRAVQAEYFARLAEIYAV